MIFPDCQHPHDLDIPVDSSSRCYPRRRRCRYSGNRHRWRRHGRRWSWHGGCRHRWCHMGSLEPLEALPWTTMFMFISSQATGRRLPGQVVFGAARGLASGKSSDIISGAVGGMPPPAWALDPPNLSTLSMDCCSSRRTARLACVLSSIFSLIS